MIQMQLQLERKDDGLVQVRVLDMDSESNEPSVLVWECTVALETTREAQKAALKATMDYLNRFIDLSEGGRYY